MEYNIRSNDDSVNEVILSALKDLEDTFFADYSDSEGEESNSVLDDESISDDDFPDIPLNKLNEFNFVDVPDNYIEDKIYDDLKLKIKKFFDKGQAPKNMDRIEVNYDLACDIFKFLKNYSNIHGMPSPGRHCNKITMPTVFLPTSFSYASVYRNYVQAYKDKYDDLQDNYESFTIRPFSFNADTPLPTIDVKPLSQNRQEELYKEIAPYIDLPFRNITCPEPKIQDKK
ncbi:18107_t:CDS:2 [Gigaspora rosea]|nr:18107_t:CDS:2 [Gigaspora rosea]